LRAVDLNNPEFEQTAAYEFLLLDLKRFDNCLIATASMEEVYALAADPDGIGFIETHKAEILRNNKKSPAALCRKVALAADGEAIEVWGDSEQTRSYCYIDDCVDGSHRLMRSDHREPLNLGTDRLVSVNQLVDFVAGIAGKTIYKSYDLTKPVGVRGRSDNTRWRQVLGWEPGTSLEDGLARTYRWTSEQLEGAGRISRPCPRTPSQT
jgi:hypothetical protein